MPCF